MATAMEQFITRSIIKHGSKYGYDKVVYRGNLNSVIIICPVHGEFTQMAIHHVRGQGCPKCAASVTV